MHPRSRFLAFLLSITLALAAGGAASARQALGEVGTNLTPQVSYRLEPTKDQLLLVIEAAPLPGETVPPKIEVGIHGNAKPLHLTLARPTETLPNGLFRYRFPIQYRQLGAQPPQLKTLRLAFTAEWLGAMEGIKGAPALRQRFLHTGPGAVHRPLSHDPKEWQEIDLAEYAQRTEEERLQIAFSFSQPLDGKATLVIEDAEGRRVRNLFAAQPYRQGEHRIVWDGADDHGTIVLPGTYRWRAISHPGLAPVYQTEFLNAPGSNHGTFQTGAFNGQSLFFAASVAEGGHEVVELDREGRFLRGMNPPHGHGLAQVRIAADERYLYLAHEGRGWTDGNVDRKKPNWKANHRITLARIDLQTGQPVPVEGRSPYRTLVNYEVGPGSPNGRAELADRLGGFTLGGEKLYFGDRDTGEIVILSAATGNEEGRLPLREPVALAFHNGALYAVAGQALVQVDLSGKPPRQIATLPGKPVSLAVGEEGAFYVADQATHQVHRFSSAGKLERTIGKAGGLVAGPYDPLQLQNPLGLVVTGEELWVTEHDRWQPKRLASYHTRTGEVAREFFGPTSYGAPGGGFDPLDHQKWIGQETFFDVDFATGKATPRRVMDRLAANRLFTIRRHQYWRQDGRTFLISSGKATFIQEVMDNGHVRPLAMISSAHQFAYSCNWQAPEAFERAFLKAWPDAKVHREQQHEKAIFRPHHGYGMMWVDLNGDGQFQEEEFDFATDAENFGGSGWSHDFHDLTFRMIAHTQGRNVVVAIEPDGFYDNGVPRYPKLNDALKTAPPIDLDGKATGQSSAVDRFKRLIFASSPEMTAYAPDGRRLWSYPNLWNNVHGSHRAPLPETGQLQGVLFFSGVAPLDETSDVFFLNGNHGQGFIMTSDGLYLDAVFPDVRMLTNPFASGIGILGGECFGGAFGRSEKDGNFYYQGGGLCYRIYRIEGLKALQRQEGKLEVTPTQITAAERRTQRTLAETPSTVEATIPKIEKPTRRNLPRVAQWSKGPGQYPVTLQAGYDAEHLHLLYKVRDPSPWVNHGKDWQALFKTGDGVDLQLGTDPAANPRRLHAVPGDLRLFIAPMGEENVAVLYRHRVPGADPEGSVEFQSPWRSEKVDQVIRLEGVQIEVNRKNEEYELYARIPLEALGLQLDKELSLRGDFGVIYGDAAGTINLLRNYWSNQATGLVNDVPGEILLAPAQWGAIRFSPASPTP